MPTRGSRRRVLSFTESAPVVNTRAAPSRTNHTGARCGLPSRALLRPWPYACARAGTPGTAHATSRRPLFLLPDLAVRGDDSAAGERAGAHGLVGLERAVEREE